MANQLISVFTGALAGHPQPLVDARALHTFLGAGRDFSNWIKDRIERYQFSEGEDFSTVLAKTSPAGGRPATDYHLSLDMAKELAMVERSDKGREVRRYFIACERQLQLGRHQVTEQHPLVQRLQQELYDRDDAVAMLKDELLTLYRSRHVRLLRGARA